MIKNILSKEINEIINTLKLILNSENNVFNQLCLDCKKSLNLGGKIMFCGNGGSAADSQHLATELVVRYQKKRKAIAAISLSTDTSALTAIGNDFSFENIFSRQVEAIGNNKDILICITTSGNSLNVIKALKMAQKKDIKCYCLSGNKGGKIKKLTKNIVLIPSNKTSVIQICELTLGQILCDYLERNI